MSQPASQPTTHSRLPSEIWQKVFKVILTDLDSPTSRAYKALAVVSGINTNARNAVATMPENEELVSKAQDRVAFANVINIPNPISTSQPFTVITTYVNATYMLKFSKPAADQSVSITSLNVKHNSQPSIELLYPDTEFPSPLPDPLKCDYNRGAVFRNANKNNLNLLLDRCSWYIKIVSEQLASQGITVKNNDFAKAFNVRMCELPILKRVP